MTQLVMAFATKPEFDPWDPQGGLVDAVLGPPHIHTMNTCVRTLINVKNRDCYPPHTERSWWGYVLIFSLGPPLFAFTILILRPRLKFCWAAGRGPHNRSNCLLTSSSQPLKCLHREQTKTSPGVAGHSPRGCSRIPSLEALQPVSRLFIVVT